MVPITFLRNLIPRRHISTLSNRIFFSFYIYLFGLSTKKRGTSLSLRTYFLYAWDFSLRTGLFSTHRTFRYAVDLSPCMVYFATLLSFVAGYFSYPAVEMYWIIRRIIVSGESSRVLNSLDQWARRKTSIHWAEFSNAQMQLVSWRVILKFKVHFMLKTAE